MELKIQRDVYNLTEDDRILFNGSVYILTTRKKSDGFRSWSPTVSASTMKKLIKNGEMIEISSKMMYLTADGREMWNKTYKPNIKGELKWLK